MNIADIDGRIHEKRKRERDRVLTFAAICCAFFIAILALVMVMGGNQ